MSEEKKSDSSGPANKPQSTDDLKRFLNSDPEELPESQARTPEFGPGGADADTVESDVGRGEDDANLVAEQPLSAQQNQAEVPDEVKESEDLDEEGDEMQRDEDASAGNETD